MARSDNPKLDKKYYSRLGESVAPALEATFLNKRELYKTSLVKGFLTGLASVLGATIGIALILWVLNFFDDIPLVGEFFKNAKSTIETR